MSSDHVLRAEIEQEFAEVERVKTKIAEALVGENLAVAYNAVSNVLARIISQSEEPMVAYAAMIIAIGNVMQLTQQRDCDNEEGERDERTSQSTH
jgi:hypothetical protein